MDQIVTLPYFRPATRTERFDVSATSSLSHATADDRTAPLRAMLADRFTLALHVEKREQQAYDLVLARADRRLGPGLKPVETDRVRIAAERAAAPEAVRKRKFHPFQSPDRLLKVIEDVEPAADREHLALEQANLLSNAVGDGDVRSPKGQQRGHRFDETARSHVAPME